jgi:alkylation response protein AidB-like acyl-CoA dehydrogenase
VDLDLSEEQQMLREMVRGVCSSYADLTVVRKMEDDPTGFPTELWKQMAALDLIGLMLPAEFGGSEMSMLEGAVVYQELGRALAPSPHFVSAVVSANTLLRVGATDILPAIVSGDEICSVAWLEPNKGFSPRGVQARAGADGTITGTKWYVPYASAATKLLVLARTGDGDDDVDLFLVDPAGSGVELTQRLTIASDTQYEVKLDAAPAERVGGGWAVWRETMLDAIILLAAQAVGGAQYALEITVQYAKDREQFDKPLGAFQAISHYLADAVTAVDGAEMLAYEAAWARADGRNVERLAPMAKLFACRTYRDVTAMAQQVFGGVGFTVEYDIQLYFRRAKQLQISWYDERTLEEMIATAVL